MSTGLLIGLLLLAGNAFFVGAEFALISARRSQIEPLAAAGSRRARTALRAMEHVSLMMASAQLGITACSLGLGAVAEPAVAHLIEEPLHALHVPSQLLHPIAFTIAMSIVVFLHMVLGEMVPKNIAIAGPERAALWLGPPLAAVTTALKPVIVALNATANAILRLVRVEPRDEVASTYNLQQVADLIAESRREGLLDADEHHLLTGALTLNQQTVATVLLPRDQLVTIPATATPAEVQDTCVSTGYSRFPVTDATGNLTGYVHVKDLLAQCPTGSETLPTDYVRPLATISIDEPLQAALTTMQNNGTHLARVTDDAGAQLGVAALEDVLEKLVGEIRDATQGGLAAA